jgi:hypothetical protein
VAAPAPPGEAPRNAQYILAGDARISSPLYIDDFVRVFVDGALVGEFPGCVQGKKDCHRLPIRFQAPPGSRLTIEAYDRGGSYGTDGLFLYKNGGRAELLVEASRCDMPALPCPTSFGAPVMYFRESFDLP